MKNSETKDFVAYEYLSINVISEKEALYTDCYENFGWILTNNNVGALIDREDLPKMSEKTISSLQLPTVRALV